MESVLLPRPRHCKRTAREKCEKSQSGWPRRPSLPSGLAQHRQLQPAVLLEAGQLAAQRPRLALLLLPLLDLLHQGIDHLVLQDVADDLAALEDDPLAL